MLNRRFGIARGCYGKPVQRGNESTAALPLFGGLLSARSASRLGLVPEFPPRDSRVSRAGSVLRKETNAFVRHSGRCRSFLIDQTRTQVKGNDPLLGHAELLDRGFDFGHGAHAAISTVGTAAGKCRLLAWQNYEMKN